MQRMKSPASVNGFCRKGEGDNEPLELFFMKDFFKHNRFFLFAVALASVFTFSSCGDDDDDCDCKNQEYLYDPLPNPVDKGVSVSASDMMENWVLDSYKHVYVSNGKEKVVDEQDYSTNSYRTFLNGLSGYRQGFNYRVDSSYDEGTWKYSDGHIYIYYYGDIEVYTIIQYVDTHMILRTRIGDDKTGEYRDYKYKKIGTIEAYLASLKEKAGIE